MLVVCSVDESKYWQSFKEQSSVAWVETLEEAAGKNTAHVSIPVSPEALLSFCDQYPNAKVIVVVSSMERQLATLLHSEPSNALDVIKQTVEGLLRVQTQKRQQIKLVADSSIYTGQLKKEFNANLISLQSISDENHCSRLERVVALHMIESSSSLSKLNQQLVASFSIPEDKSVFAIDASIILDQYSQTETDISHLSEENQVVTAQLQGVLEAYEKLYDKHTSLQQWNNEKKTSIKSLKNELKQAKRKLTENQNSANEIRTELAQARVLKQSSLIKLSVKIDKLLKSFGSKSSKKQEYLLDLNLLKTSDLFDADWYLKTYTDVAEAGLDPAEHYLTSGAEEGRYPSQRFNGRDYLKRYSDVAKENINPLIHYIKFGRKEGRTISSAPVAHS
ncbi:hypothetical protein IT774_01795 [Salinimonas marina]|uniref:Uncharacterized protein n=1 Tax=Salinimonas marina TaxID=2785918 RepID=A0A7S9DY04_9ALTE|nr:hypothetical protein [Salinimonas marina]QPG06014.1 hypothetical protein IT774_01795 [Salinimonas marina]